MNNETAISILGRLMKIADLSARKYSKDETIKNFKEALELAIKALEEKVKNEKYGSELARIVAEHEEVMSREIGSFECDGKCDSCELGVPIDGQFYDDGTPIHECGYKSGGDT